MSERVVRLVRHGRAAAGWDRDPDPDLDDVGRRQADEVATTLASLVPVPATILTSPLLRCRSTAAPFAVRVGGGIVVEPGVAEIPSPEGVEMDRWVEWLRTAMRGTWAELGERYTSFRDQVVEVVTACPHDTVVFSHFVAINAVIGACLGDDRLVIRSLDNCSVTTIALGDGAARLVEGGREADTLIR